MDSDRTPRASSVTLDNAEAQAERRIQSHGSPIATRTLNNASGYHANGPADNSQGAKNLPNAPPVPPKALILPAESEKSPSDSWGQQQESYTRESGCRSPRRNLSSTSRSGWESNLYTPSHRTAFRRMSRDIAPGIDALVPVIQGRNGALTVGERMQDTIVDAEKERDFSAKKAKRTNFILNVATGLQVMLGALLTGLSAVTVGKQTYVITSILGAVSTLVASYLARSRGSNEPELSISRVKDLDHFLRDCRAFRTDYGYAVADNQNGLDKKLEELRHRFQELLGSASSERQMSSTV